MKNKVKILIIALFMASSSTVFSQNCSCVPPIESVCVKPCFVKKIFKFESRDLKALLDANSTLAINDSLSNHNMILSETILMYVKEKKTLDKLKLNKRDEENFDKVLESKEFKTVLENK